MSPIPAAEPAPAPAPDPDAVRAPLFEFREPGFHNPIAIRVGWIAASIGALLNQVIFWGIVVWMVGAGFFSVFLFSRRAKTALTVRAGARMGWITGVLSFVIMTVLLTLNVVLLSQRPGGLPAFYRAQFGEMAKGDPNVEQALQILDSGTGMAVIFLFVLAFLFTLVTMFCAAGGALGAKVLDKER